MQDNLFVWGASGGPAGCFAALSLGDGHAAAISVRGDLLTWGRNARGQCGHALPAAAGDDDAAGHDARVPPQLVRFPPQLAAASRHRSPLLVHAVACGSEHTLAVTSVGVFAWGCNAFGQCGLGDAAPDTVPLPAPVPALRAFGPVSQLAAGRAHSLALTASSQVLSWGDGASGQLGLGDRRPRRAPTAVGALWALPVVQIAAGDAHSVAVTSNGHAFAWGCNYFGQLGLGQEAGVPALQAEAGAAVPQQRAADGAPPPLPQRARIPLPGPPGSDEGLGAGAAAAQLQEQQEPEANLRLPGTPRFGARANVTPYPNQPGTPRTPGSVRRAVTRRTRTRSGSTGGRVNPQWLLAMVEMGIPASHARIALEETGNAGVEVATEWLFATDRSAILEGEDEQPSPHNEATPAASAAPCPTADGAARAAGAGSGPSPAAQPDPHAASGSSGAAGGSRRCCFSGGERPTGPAVESLASSPGDVERCGRAGGGGVDDSGAGSSPGGASGSDGWYGSSDEYGSPDGGWWEDLVVMEPRRVPLKDVRVLAAGARHTVAVTDDGVYAWGEGAAGALGLGDRHDRDTPCRIDAFQPPTAAAATAAAGEVPLARGPSSAAAVGPLAGDAAAVGRQPYVRSRLSSGCSAATGGGGGEAAGAAAAAAVGIQRVACGSQHTLFLAQDGAVYWCGTVPYGYGHDAAAACGGVATAVVGKGSAEGAGAQPQPRQPCAGDGSGPAALDCGMAAGAPSGDGGGGSGGVVFSATPQRLDLGSGGAGGASAFGRFRRPSAAAAEGAGAVVVYDVIARGGGSAVLLCSPRELPQVPYSACGPQQLLAKLRAAIQTATEAARSGRGGGGSDLARLSASWKAVTAGVRTVLGSPAALSAAFGRRSGVGLDGQLLEEVLGSIRRLMLLGGGGGGDGGGGGGGHDGGGGGCLSGTVSELHRFALVAALQSSAAVLVEEVRAHMGELDTPERAQVLLAALQHPLLSEPRCAAKLVPQLAAAVTGAPPVVRTWLVRWWAEYPGPLLEKRLVAPLQSHLTRELGATKKLTGALMAVIQVLGLVEEAARLSHCLPPEVFYNRLISEKLDVQDHYSAWRQAQELSASPHPPRDLPFSFCSYPFLLNARAKSHLLHLEARFQMEQSVADARMEVQLYGRGAAAQRRAAEGLVLVKAAGAAVNRRHGLHRHDTSGGSSSSNSSNSSNSSSAAVAETSGCNYSSLVSGSSGGGGGGSSSHGGASQSSSRSSSSRESNGASSTGCSLSLGRGGSGGGDGGGSSLSGCSRDSGRSSGSRSGGWSGFASGMVGGSLRRLYSLLLLPRARRRSSGSGGSSSRGGSGSSSNSGSGSSSSSRGSCGGPDDVGERERGQKVESRGGGGSIEQLPSPAECSVPGVHSDMCIVRVRRTALVADAVEELGRQARRDLLKPLRVHFIGEEGIDAGGVKKEFFALLMERLLSADYGMMSYDEASRTYWFNPSSLEPPSSYFLLGLVLGLAVYNRVLLDFPAPLLLYQKLGRHLRTRTGTRTKGAAGAGEGEGEGAAWAKTRQQGEERCGGGGGRERELGLRDLEAWQPGLARGLRQLLEYDGPEPLDEVFGLTFSVDVDRFGALETVPLKPGGELLPVTEDNRSEYVSLLAGWYMVGAVAPQFEAFAEGFRAVCWGPAMSLFNAQELERLVCGNPRLDFGALRDAARYEGGYSRDTPVVRWLWDIVLHELSPEDQRAFLKFFTGSDRSPLGGLGSLRPVIQRDGSDCRTASPKLPTAHTCFNTLLLPEYDTRQRLAERLRLAINNSEGFGLQ
ncbi:hypothetical protein PLESTB_000776500 [Pleodorina starrii]|uniref:Uncharacterized protein n=1 Tax=Pleodorina starrii TaxID=330485 RepID=A0A9W6BKI5_9CHLO|nr:hypothetical protein PLESTM_000508000 [Pleodorina starrii]GLC53688.1 hypothetical protein PLESTB_000776500 [Pleodorina starrii]GLC72871.1 hypothetical protein PLESTF_001304400 [Pleodorina starrii]